MNITPDNAASYRMRRSDITLKTTDEYTESEIWLDVGEGTTISVHIARPVTNKPLSAFIYAHGGGGVIGTNAED